jgi:hypothetical protein
MVIHIEPKGKYLAIDHMELAGTVCPPHFFLYSICHVVWTGNPVVCTRSTNCCSVYDMMQLLYDNDRPLPPRMNEANDSWLDLAWNAQKFASSWKVAAVRDLQLNISVSFYMNHPAWWLSSPNFTFFMPVFIIICWLPLGRIKCDYIDPLFSVTMACCGATTFCKLPVGKLDVPRCGCTRTDGHTHTLILRIFLDSKHLHSAWVVNAASFCSSCLTAHICPCIFTFFSIRQILLLPQFISLLLTVNSQNHAGQNHTGQWVTVFFVCDCCWDGSLTLSFKVVSPFHLLIAMAWQEEYPEDWNIMFFAVYQISIYWLPCWWTWVSVDCSMLHVEGDRSLCVCLSLCFF